MPVRLSVVSRGSRARPGVGTLTACFVAAVLPLAGCGMGADGLASLSVDPAKYAGYHCKELVGQWNGLVGREKQLRNLIDKASEGGGALAAA